LKSSDPEWPNPNGSRSPFTSIELAKKTGHPSPPRHTILAGTSTHRGQWMAILSANLLRHITRHAAAATPNAILLARFVADRDGEAFAALVRRHGPIVYRVCRRLVGINLADDAFQATFLVLATRAGSVRKPGSLGSWLVGVAGRVARQMHKAERRRMTRERAAATFAVPDHGNDHADSAEQARILDDELTRLSDRLRGPVVVCLLHGRTYEQAAAELGGSARTVRRRLDEAKRVLRARLERRGVVPAFAAALVAGINAADGTVPAGLSSRTATVVSGFLAGGSTIPAALIAKGVATTMTTSMRMVTVLLATAAAGLTALGVGLAGDGKQSPPAAPPIPAAGAEPAAIPTNDKPAGVLPGVAMTPDSVPIVFTPPPPPYGWPGDPPSGGALRAVQAEAKYLRTAITARWLGSDEHAPKVMDLDFIGIRAGSPLPAPRPDGIGIIYWRGGEVRSLTTTMNDGGRMVQARVELSGPLDEVIDNQLPREMTHLVLTERFGRPFPRWGTEGMAILAESGMRQAETDNRRRTALVEGHAIRLSALLRAADYPKDSDTFSAQAHSVVRFLLSRKPQPAPIEIVGYDGKPIRLPATCEGTFLGFLMKAAKGDWNTAIKEVYGIEDVTALEVGWLDWMKGQRSQMRRPAPAVDPASSYPPLIPPVKLP
jgi:RNA polymerase sigma factor (sigma-70 family)